METDRVAFNDDFDWGRTPLGPKNSWEQSLRTTYEIVMSTGFAMCITWGPDQTILYNEAYAPFLGKRHPEAMGRPMPEVWYEIWKEITPIVDRAMSGEAVFMDNLHLVMTRNGFEEDTFWRFSYSPLRNDAGKIVGFLNVTTDMTETVLLRDAMQQKTENLIESEAKLLKLVTAGAYSLYRMSPDWIEMRQLDGQGIIEDTRTPTIKWLDVYIDEDDRPGVSEAIGNAIAKRETFEHEHRVKLPGGGFGWVHSRAVPIFDQRGEIIEWFGAAADITIRKQAEQQQEVLTHEISHRLKNILAVVQSIAWQTIRTAPDLPSAQKALASRLQALARSQDVLLTGTAATTDLRGIIDATIRQHGEDSVRFEVDGPPVEIDPAAALNLTLTLHELSTNAAKYGALGPAGGTVSIRWRIDNEHLHLEWEENGGPKVVPPTTKGFGSKLIERSLVGGKTSVHYDPSGLRYTLVAPLSKLVVSD